MDVVKKQKITFSLCFLAESFETHYGEGGRDGDGDVFKEANIKAFAKFVLEGTDGKGKKVFRIYRIYLLLSKADVTDLLKDSNT